MKAGAALGLLAGLGALNAIRGGRDGTGKRFTGLIDMLDGGGAGASGDKFEGGGLLSILGNLFAKPLEAQDNVERIAADTNATNAVTEVLKNEVLKKQIVPTYGAAEGIAATNRAMNMPYNQSFTPPAVTKELTGSADMPPELLPMTTLKETESGNDAFSQLFNRSVEQGYQGMGMPSYEAEKRLIEMAAYPESEGERNIYTDLKKLNYSSLMPPSEEDFLMEQYVWPSYAAKRILPNPASMAQDTIRAANTAEDRSNTQNAVNMASSMNEQNIPKTPDPMGLLPRQTMIPPAATNMDAPSVGALLDVPSASPSETQVMLQKLMGSVPKGLGPLNTDEYRDYILGGGRLPYSEYEKTTPEYRALEALMKQYEGFQMMPIEEKMRLIAERADIIRRETPKPVPFTGPAF